MGSFMLVIRWLCTVFFLFSFGSVSAADFIMNFNANGSGFPALLGSAALSTCNRDGFGSCLSSSQGNAEPTPFLYETVNLGGIDYVHLVVGDPSDGFSQDVYIEGFVSNFSTSTAAHGASQVDAPIGGAGQASAHPSKVTVYQIVSDGDIDMTFLKDTLNTKPLITQDLNTADLSAQFSMDMRAVSYADSATAIGMTNTLSIVAAGMELLDFDAVADAEDSLISGGQYIYTEGLGELGSEGGYTYVDGGFDVGTVDWCSFWDADQNTFEAVCN